MTFLSKREVIRILKQHTITGSIRFILKNNQSFVYIDLDVIFVFNLYGEKKNIYILLFHYLSIKISDIVER